MEKTSYLFISIVAVVSLIIASISCLYIITNNDGNEIDIKDYMSGVVEIKCSTGEQLIGYGSGFLVEYQGIKIISNAHVVTFKDNNGTTKAYDSISARFFDSEQEYDISIVSYDSNKDIAVLKFDNTGPDHDILTLDTDSTRYGEKIFAIGDARGYGLSVKEGVVSIPEIIIVRDGIERPCIMISSSINDGDSGGPIIDTDGKVVGMMSFKLKDNNGDVVQGMSYGVLSQDIIAYLNIMSDQTI